VIESVFYAWRITGDTKYQDFVYAAFQSLNKYCKAPASYASLYDVDDNKTSKIDDSESFL